MQNSFKDKRAGALHKKLAVCAMLGLAAVSYAQEEKESQEAGGTTHTVSVASDATTSGPVETRLVRAVFSNMPVERAVQQLSDQAKTSITARGKTAGEKINLVLPKPIPLKDALDQIVNLRPNWVLYPPADRPGTYEIWDQETYRAEVLPKLVRPKVFTPQEITAEEAAKAIEGIKTPNIGTVAFDPRSNKVFMTDLVPVLEIAQRLIEQIDTKFHVRIFYIVNADVNQVAEKLATMKSPSAPDIQTDERTRQIIVTDRQDVLQKMEHLVETLDIGPEMRVYDINNIGDQGEGLEELETAVQEILTPNAYYKFNIRQGKLVVRDLPEVHERVEQLLAAFDAPLRQVLLQMEVIETEFADGFNWQMDYGLSDDLLKSAAGGLISGLTPSTGGTADAADPSRFVSFRNPSLSFGASGVSGQYVSRHAFFKLNSLMSDSRTRILQQPRILVKNQGEANLNVGQSVPFFTGGSIGYSNDGGNGNVLTPSQPVMQQLQVGLTLNVIPTIAANGLIEMQVTVTNDTPLIVTRIFNGQSFDGVGKNTQELDTQLIIPSGETRVIGGLIADQKSETRQGIPGLMKIPVIGPALFGSYNRPADNNRRRNLLIFLTPTIVEETASNMVKYKGYKIGSDNLDYRIVEEDTFTTPSTTVSDLAFGSTLLPPDKTAFIPPAEPDFEAMSRGVLPPARKTSVKSTSLGTISSTVDPEAIEKARKAASDELGISGPGASAFQDLKKISIKDPVNNDPLNIALDRVPSPAGLMSSGSQGLVKPPTPSPAPGQPPAQPNPQGQPPKK